MNVSLCVTASLDICTLCGSDLNQHRLLPITPIKTTYVNTVRMERFNNSPIRYGPESETIPL